MESISKNNPTGIARTRPLWWLTVLVIGTAFFAAGHDVTTSAHDAFTQTADEMEQTALGGDHLRQIGFLSIGFLGTLFLLRGSRESLRFDPLTGLPLLLFVLWCGASVIWSDDMSLTMRRLVVAGCFAVGAFGIARQFSLRELLRMTLCITTAFLVIGVLAELAVGTFRPWSGGYRFAGSVHPNTQGVNLGMLCLSAFCLARSGSPRRVLLYALFAVGFAFLVLTKSRTSLGGLLIAMSPLWALKYSTRFKILTGTAGLWIVSAVLLGVLLSGVDFSRDIRAASQLGRNEEGGALTGRIPIWTELLPFARERLLTGYGYDSFWTPDRIDIVSGDVQWGLREAHSAYLDAVLSVGLVGMLTLVGAALMGLFRSAQRYLKTGDVNYCFIFGLLMLGLIDSATESGMLMTGFMPFVALCGLGRLAFCGDGYPFGFGTAAAGFSAGRSSRFPSGTWAGAISCGSTPASPSGRATRR